MNSPASPGACSHMCTPLLKPRALEIGNLSGCQQLMGEPILVADNKMGPLKEQINCKPRDYFCSGAQRRAVECWLHSLKTHTLALEEWLLPSLAGLALLTPLGISLCPIYKWFLPDTSSVGASPSFLSGWRKPSPFLFAPVLRT